MDDRALPSGTVTMLFTDIEASTRLLTRTGAARYERVLTDHREILRTALRAHRGHEVGTEGDSMFAAFGSATDAVAAACRAQMDLAAHAFDDDVAPRVRMGVHTAEVAAVEGSYVGLGVHEARRICDAAHGGQILVSERTRGLVDAGALGAVGFIDVGPHRLKDLGEPQRLHQVVHPLLARDFPPPRTLEVAAHNLPVQLTSFVGRDRELAEVVGLVRGSRLVTLTGAAGVGKTRLALQAAADLLGEFSDGLRVVELASISEPDRVVQVVAATLGVRHADPDVPPDRQLADHVRGRRVLVVLDNCEHLLDASSRVAELIVRSGDGPHVLATSREPLGVPGEVTWRVPSLGLPNGGADPSEAEAVRLFVERASLASPGFSLAGSADAVAHICRRLDGIPLAIELAAAKVRVLACADIAAHLDDAFRLLTGGSRTALERQQTLRAAIDWSHRLLDDRSRVLLRRLSVFSGGWTLEGAEAVCSGDGLDRADVLDLLTGLVDKSLVVVERHDTGTRYRLLETIRQYAREKLYESGEGDAVRTRHYDYVLDFVERSIPGVVGPDQRRVFERLEAEHDNVRAALQWAIDCSWGRRALRLAVMFYVFWLWRGHYIEGRSWLERTLDCPDGPPFDRPDPEGISGIEHWRAAAKIGTVWFRCYLGHAEAAAPLADELVEQFRGGDDRSWLGAVLRAQGYVAMRLGEIDRAEAMLHESLGLLRECNRPFEVSFVLQHLGQIALRRGDPDAAREHFERSLAIRREMADERSVAESFACLADAAMQAGDLRAVRELAARALASARDLGETELIVWALHRAGVAAARAGDLATAREHFAEEAALERDARIHHFFLEALLDAAMVELEACNHDGARALIDQADDLARQRGRTEEAAEVAVARGRWARATGEPSAAHAFLEALDASDGETVGAAADGLAGLAADEAAWDRAARLLGAASVLRGAFVSRWPPGLRWSPALERDGTTVRDAMGAEAFEAAWTAGNALSPDEALAFARAAFA